MTQRNMNVRRKFRRMHRDADTYHCVWCLRRPPEVELQVDHKMPLYMGGEDSVDNMQLLCPTCHKHKTDMDRKADRIRSKSTRARKPKTRMYRSVDGKVKFRWRLEDELYEKGEEE